MSALLRMRCDQHGVSTGMVAKRDDLERLATEDEPDVPALAGWRKEIFGGEALELRAGRLALTGNGNVVRTIALGDGDDPV